MVSIATIIMGLALSVASASASLDSLATFDVPVFDYNTVQHAEVPARMLDALQADGILALKNIPNYANLRERYLLQAAECAAITKDASFVTHKLFEDQTQRYTISTKAGRHLIGSAKDTDVLCPGYRQLYEAFSQTIEHAVHTFGNTLDKSSFTASDGHTTIPTRQLISDALRLDHFHAYEAAAASASDTTRNLALSLPLHEDHGLFIAMAAPTLFTVKQGGRKLVEQALEADASGLVIQLSNGERVRPVLKSDELVVMMGSGATRWLETSPPLRAVLHGMKMPSVADTAEDGTRHLRAWFGKMTLLPPSHRVLWGGPALFQEIYGNLTRRHLTENDLKTVGCAGDRQLQASATCTHRQCQAKTGATPSLPCNTLCNRQGHGAADGEECTKSCDCVEGGSGDMCWMLCVANLPESTCPLDKQECDTKTQEMKCLVPASSPTQSPTQPSSSPTQSPTQPPTTQAPITKSPTATVTHPPTTSSPTSQPPGSTPDSTPDATVSSTIRPTSSSTPQSTTSSDASSSSSSSSKEGATEAGTVKQADAVKGVDAPGLKITSVPSVKNASETNFVMSSVVITVAAVIASLM